MKTIGKRRKKFRSFALGILQHMPKTRLAVRHHYWRHEARQYNQTARRIPIDSKKVFFESFGGRSFSCSPKALYLAMLQDSRFDDYEFVWCFKGQNTVNNYRKMTVFSRATVVQRGSSEYFEALASAKTLILNTRLPEYVMPKPDQVFVQCWHGTPLKRLGYDVKIETANALNTTSELAERFGMDCRKWTYLLSPSTYTSQHLADAFGLPENRRASTILQLGYPRNDALAQAACDGNDRLVREMKFRMGIPDNKKVLLYAPTWRDDSYKAGVGYTFDYLIDFDTLQRALGKDWVVLFRPHYYIANSFDFSAYRGFVYDASNVDDINDLYLISDALVTDYSSVMFDYSILRRPMFFFVPDKKHYAADIRGFYFDFSKVPGPQSTTTTQLIDDVRHIGDYWHRFGETYDEFTDTFCPIDDGHATERVLNRLFTQRAVDTPASCTVSTVQCDANPATRTL